MNQNPKKPSKDHPWRKLYNITKPKKDFTCHFYEVSEKNRLKYLNYFKTKK